MEIQWTLLLFTAVSGTGAWLFATTACDDILKKPEKAPVVESVVALLLLLAGGLLSVAHLSHPDRILEALNRPTSGIFIEAALIGVLGLTVLIYLLITARSASLSARRVLAGIGLVLGVIFSFACGSSYMMAARPAWDSIALPLAYLGTAAAAGGALNLFLKAVLKREPASIRFAAILALALAALGIVLALVYYLGAGSALSAAQNDGTGWVVVLFAALVIDGICSVLCLRDTVKSPALAALSACAAATGIVGAVALRAVMWITGIGILNFFDQL
ncbi:MAG: dimethyl sulfoxide reductase anchor subunit [Coriobacteriales bacterium]|jgi:anaerobic dimethyl sulfoxide reductase subunit C (anchor subunit)|nr:dimethyl sulfoxide reductase anchor subunit [Coriobacteriales bacterium]